MTNSKKRVVDNQPSLFDILVEHIKPASSIDSELNISARLRHSLNTSLKTCPLSRWEIAGRMSHLLGHEITKFMIDSWTAESKEDYRIPGEYLPAFCSATGSIAPLHVISEASGVFTLPGPDALRAEIQKLDEETKRLIAEKRKRILFLEEMEKKK